HVAPGLAVPDAVETARHAEQARAGEHEIVEPPKCLLARPLLSHQQLAARPDRYLARAKQAHMAQPVEIIVCRKPPVEVVTSNQSPRLQIPAGPIEHIALVAMRLSPASLRSRSTWPKASIFGALKAKNFCVREPRWRMKSDNSCAVMPFAPSS